MKWLGVVLLVIVSFLLIPTTVLAGTSEEVTVTATGYICDAPGGLTLTYVSDYEIGVSWFKGAGAVSTLVRVAYGRFPEDRSDGIQLYYGEGTNTTHWLENIGLVGTMYYRAWSQNAAGWWEEVGAEGEASFMSQSFMFIGLIVLALGTTATSFWKRNIVLSMGAALSWTSLGILLITSSTLLGPYSLGDGWVQVLSLLLFSMAAGCLLYFISGIGKTRITMTDASGKSWGMWGKPPSGEIGTRSQLVRANHKKRLSAARDRRNTR